MPLPALPMLSADAAPDVVALHRYLGHLKNSLDGFTPSQVAAALDLGGLGYGPGSPFDGITLPSVPATPDTPTGLQATGFYKQIALSWDLDPNPNITGWEVQRADDLAFTLNVTSLTSARALAFLDLDRADSTAYYYRIRAITNDPSVASSYTAVETATTLASTATVLDQLKSAVIFLQRAHIRDAVIDTAKITDAAIVSAKIADLAVTTAKIAALAVTTAKIDDLAVSTAKIASLAVTNAKINDVSADKLTAGTIDVLVELTNQTITLDGANSVITITDTQGSPVIRVKLGKLAGGADDYGLICYDASGGIMFDSTDQGATSLGIEDLAVISAKLDDLAVLTGKINTNAVTANVAYASAAVGFTRDGTTHGTGYADTGATVTLVKAEGTAVPVKIVAVCNMLVGSNTGAATLDRCVGAIKLVRDSTDLRFAGLAVNNHGNAAAPNFIGPVTISFLDTGLAAGSYAYKIQGAATNANTVVTIDIIDLEAREYKR